MKIYIGNYKSWIGPQQLADLFRYVGVGEETREKIGDYFNDGWVRKVCEYIYSKRERTIKIKLHDFDTWNLDSTLAFIIAPCLKQLKETNHGSPSGIENSDVSEELKSDQYGVRKNLHQQWSYILDEMIWTFESINNLDHIDMTKEEQERQQNGLRLFSKYYTGLWT